MKRVLVVDDSPSVRELLIHILDADPELEVVGWAVDGEDAVRLAQIKKPDVITMDLHMPNVDGFEATRIIMQTCAVPIVIVSGSENSAEVSASFRAIEAGALVVVKRPFGIGHPSHAETAAALVRTVKSMSEVKVVRRWSAVDQRNRRHPNDPPARNRMPEYKLVLMGASTGGPAVLRDILAQLPANYRLPIVIVQHMSPGFVKGLAEWLSSVTGYPVSLATHDERLVGGRAYLAPDGYHIGITRDLRIILSTGPVEHGMRPAVSYLFRSAPKDLRPGTIAVLLTGMGKDGAVELKQLKNDGSITIVQDRASSVVYGMPGEAIKQDAAMHILEPTEIGKTLQSIAAQSMSTST